MMNTRYRYILISAVLLALFLPALSSQSFAGGFCEEGYPLPKPDTDQIRDEGRIDRIEEAYIVIDDRGFRLLPSTEYYNHVMRRVSVHHFREGQPVGCIVNKDAEILILWLYKDPRGAAKTTLEPATPSEE